jgi:divalent metal cation (Fe/Co/Zn/Cd) transporter
MSSQSGYKKQQNLSFVQLLSEAPAFIVTLVSAIFANTMLLFVDLVDSFGNLLRTAMVTTLSKKLSKDLRFEYNYGVGKIEAIVSLFCNGIVFFGLLLTIGMSIYSIVFPEKPSDSVIAVVGVKVINVNFDATFFVKQRKILKIHRSAISETNYAAALAALLFDAVTLISLLIIWLFRNNPIGVYISPVISIFIAIYLVVGCIKRTKVALEDLTDKTLPEELQMRILNILVRFYDRYSQVSAINSHKSGDVMRVDLYLSFEKNTNIEEIVEFKDQIQEEFDRQIGNCIVNIIVGDN